MNNRKAQVDIALILGSIVVPVAVLLGALIFAWAMISPVTDAGRTAGLLTHDLATMTDIAYSASDSIRIIYAPASNCKMAKDVQGANIISCFNGFMNVSSEIRIVPGSFETEFPAVQAADAWLCPSGDYDDEGLCTSGYELFLEKNSIQRGTRNIPYANILQTSVTFAQALPGTTSQSTNIQYSSFANFGDFEFNRQAEVALEVTDKGVVFEKTREGIYDTLMPAGSFNLQSTDPLAYLVNVSYQRCSGSFNFESSITLKPGYFMRTSGNTELCIYKAMIFPDVTHYMVMEDATTEQTLCEDWMSSTLYYIPTYDQYVLSGEEFTTNTIYCFDFSQMPKTCTYDLSWWGNTANAAYNPAGPDGMKVNFTIDKTGTAVSYFEP
ncbi:MAG: hypothetical protein PHH61_01905 [Candidatus Nanoarchaeia archaeon]|nr:hypothetical protein [Candidatus Paceibacterota bacterium]MDD5239195.1 hypothetical protein [Candidatus Nanoarchaeia archaeon]